MPIYIASRNWGVRGHAAVIALDIAMPLLNGMAAAERLKQMHLGGTNELPQANF